MNTTLTSPSTTWYRKFAASRSIVTSAILHVALVAFLWGVIVTISEKPTDFVAEGGEIFEPSTNPLLLVEKPPEIAPVDRVTKPKSPVNPAGLMPLTTKFETGTIKVSVPVVTVVTGPAVVDVNLDHPKAFGDRAIPESMRGRTTAMRGIVGTKNKMTPAAEDAVSKGLNWLRDHQNADGSWGESNKGSMTGLALLCLLGRGETDQSKEYGLAVNRAIDWIMKNGEKFAGRLHMDDAFRRNSDVYEHGICTYALGEYFTMTGDKRVTELLAQAVGYIVQGQGPRGGWMYNFDKTADDLSVSGWMVQALKAAHLTGLNLPGVDAALDKSVECVEKVWKGPKGGYGYRGPEDRYSLSGVGVLCRLFWKGSPGEVNKGMDFIMDETGKNKPIKYKTENADLYAWYYHTQAALMFGGPSWTKWNSWFQNELVGAQNRDGSWPAPGQKNHGPMNEETMTGQVYRTTLCVLMLEVFYRYMPSTKAI